MQLNSEISQVSFFNACLYKATHRVGIILQSKVE